MEHREEIQTEKELAQYGIPVSTAISQKPEHMTLDEYLNTIRGSMTPQEVGFIDGQQAYSSVSDPSSVFSKVRPTKDGYETGPSDYERYQMGFEAGSAYMNTLGTAIDFALDEAFNINKVDPTGTKITEPQMTGSKGGTGRLGIVESRINIANGPTRFSPSNKAGLEHVLDRHFNPGKNAGQFTISVDELKTILGNKNVINAPVTLLETSGQYSRTVNVGEVVGTIKPSIPEVGGKSTTWMEIITDSKGNLITTYPCPAPK